MFEPNIFKKPQFKKQHIFKPRILKPHIYEPQVYKIFQMSQISGDIYMYWYVCECICNSINI